MVFLLALAVISELVWLRGHLQINYLTLMTTQVKQMDEQFVAFMLEVDMRYKQMAKSDQVKIEKWVTFKFFHLESFVVKSTLQQSMHNFELEEEQESLRDAVTGPNPHRKT
jgi:hypothetical protein